MIANDSFGLGSHAAVLNYFAAYCIFIIPDIKSADPVQFMIKGFDYKRKL